MRDFGDSASFFSNKGYSPDELQEILAGRAPRTSPFGNGAIGRGVAKNLEAALSALPSERQNMLLNELYHGALKPDNPDIGASEILKVIAEQKPDIQMRAARAYEGRGHMPESVRDSLAEIEREAYANGAAAGGAAYKDIRNKSERNAIIFAEMAAMAKDPRLQRLGETRFHSLIEAVQNGTLAVDTSLDGGSSENIANWLSMPGSGIFLVNHNWDAAFAKAQDVDGGELRIPYPLTIFEFRISGHRSILTLSNHVEDDKGEKAAMIILFVEFSVGWASVGVWAVNNDDFFGPVRDHFDSSDERADPTKLLGVLRSQARAILIALEAEVAETEVIRAPHKLNAKREKSGKIKIFDYHAVNLCARKRYLPRAPEDGGAMGQETAHRRLHFVRGHWRHYPLGKAWIKWHLRGDPDLGFIDKEYRL